MLLPPFVFRYRIFTSAGIAILAKVYIILPFLLPTIRGISGIGAAISTNPFRLWV